MGVHQVAYHRGKLRDLAREVILADQYITSGGNRFLQHGGAFSSKSLRADVKVRANLAQSLLVLVARGGGGLGGLGAVLGGQTQVLLVSPVLEDAWRYVRDGQHPVNHAGTDGRARHGVMLRLVGFLRDG